MNNLTIFKLDSNQVLENIINDYVNNISLLSNPNVLILFKSFWELNYAKNILNAFVFNYPLYNCSNPIVADDDLVLVFQQLTSVKWPNLIIELFNNWINITLNLLKQNAMSINDYIAFYSNQSTTTNKSSGMFANSYNTTTSAAALELNNNPQSMENIENFNGNQNLATNDNTNFTFLDVTKQINEQVLKTIKVSEFSNVLNRLLIRSW